MNLNDKMQSAKWRQEIKSKIKTNELKDIMQFNQKIRQNIPKENKNKWATTWKADKKINQKMKCKINRQWVKRSMSIIGEWD